jgi:CBS domain-containing protein
MTAPAGVAAAADEGLAAAVRGVITTTSIRDAAEMMTDRHFRHLPVGGDAGLLGVVDIIDVCRALISSGEG